MPRKLVKHAEGLTEEEKTLVTSYNRKTFQMRLHEASDEERAAWAKYAGLRRQGDVDKYVYTYAKANAKKRGVPFELTFAEFVSLKTPVCPITGVELDYSHTPGKGMSGKHYNSASLDRIDNTKGYTSNNCWFISWQCNKEKNGCTLETMEATLAEARKRGLWL